jgi:hypothetical protein
MVLYVWPHTNGAVRLTVLYYESFRQITCFGEAVLRRASPCKCAESQVQREYFFTVTIIRQLRAMWRNS